jgi:hypothetical protein
MKSLIAFIFATFLALVQASDLVEEVSKTLEAQSSMAQYEILPHPFGSPCGMTWDVEISTITHGDQKNTSALCQFLDSYIVQKSLNGAAEMKVNFIYVCPPNYPSPTSAIGYGYEDIKFIVTGPTQFPAVSTSFDAEMQVLNIHDGTNVPNIPIKLGFYWDTENAANPGFKFFTISNIDCP